MLVATPKQGRAVHTEAVSQLARSAPSDGLVWTPSPGGWARLHGPLPASVLRRADGKLGPSLDAAAGALFLRLASRDAADLVDRPVERENLADAR